jgi:hypothetical protein
MSHYSLDITASLPLRPGCRATLWDGILYLYSADKQCVASVPLKIGDEPTPEWIVRQVGTATWKVVSDWEPAT